MCVCVCVPVCHVPRARVCEQAIELISKTMVKNGRTTPYRLPRHITTCNSVRRTQNTCCLPQQKCRRRAQEGAALRCKTRAPSPPAWAPPAFVALHGRVPHPRPPRPLDDRETEVSVADLQQSLEKSRPVLVQTAKNIEVLMEKIEVDTAAATETRKATAVEEAAAKSKADECTAIKNDAEAILAKALPELEDSLKVRSF